MAISRMNMERQLRNMGGLMTLEEPRQGFFLGKIVRKAKKAVKKVVKSPLGKAAILGAGIYGLGGGFGSSGFSKALLKSRALSPFGKTVGGKFDFSGPLASLVSKDDKFSLGRTALTGLGATALAAPFLMGGEEEEVIDESTPFNLAQPMVSDIREQAKSYYQDPTKSALYFMPPKSAVQSQFYAAGGGLADIPRGGYSEGNSVVSKQQAAMIEDMQDKGMDMSTISSITGLTTEQITNYLSSLNQKAEGGIMDLGGMEKDYREGGFVPLGAEERADDVPARLSKNEFVFTADAVRNAGQGDIDKGAEVMQNMMDNLEAGGTISEESQGEENPAQAMFDQSQMLENRIV